MKNHWIEVHKAKHQSIWTTEFSRNAVFLLQPRLVDDVKHDITGQPTMSIVFKCRLGLHKDSELSTFLNEVSQSMTGMMSRCKRYSNISSSKPIDCYEIFDLDSASFFSTINDVKLSFRYKTLRRIPMF